MFFSIKLMVENDANYSMLITMGSNCNFAY